MNQRQTYALILGRSLAMVTRSWTQGAYSRHSDGRALQTFGVRAQTVCMVGALHHVAHEYSLPTPDFERLRYLLTAHLPRPFNADEVFGLEHWNDLATTTQSDVANVFAETREDYECGKTVRLRIPYAEIAA